MIINLSLARIEMYIYFLIYSILVIYCREKGVIYNIMASSTSNSPCAGCKLLRRKCQPECIFSPYFPPEEPQKFFKVHKVFGASNVTKLLNELHPSQREDAVNSMAYEADMRLRDPVYGCVGIISRLQHQLRQLQMDLTGAKSQLSKYQSLDLSTTPHAGLLAASTTAAASTHQNLEINLIGSGSGGVGREHHFHYQFFPRDHQQQQMIRSFDNYDASLLAMNVSAGIGQLSQYRTAAGAGDERRTIDPS